MINSGSSQPICSIFSMVVNQKLPLWLLMNTDDNTISNSTKTTGELQLCHLTILSAQTMFSATLDVVTITTTTLSTSSEMVVTTHLPSSITRLKINPLEFTLLFNGFRPAHAWCATISKNSLTNLRRNSFHMSVWSQVNRKPMNVTCRLG